MSGTSLLQVIFWKVSGQVADVTFYENGIHLLESSRNIPITIIIVTMNVLRAMNAPPSTTLRLYDVSLELPFV